MLTVFNVFTGGWVDAFQECTDEVGVAIAAPFFVSCLTIGFFIMMNLFIAILLEAFADDEEEAEEEGGEATEAEGEAAGEGGDVASGDVDGVPAIDVPPPQPSSAPDSLKRQNTIFPSSAPDPDDIAGVSLGLFPPDSAFRHTCQAIVTNFYFDTFIIVLIIVSSICLAIDVPRLDKASDLGQLLVVLNYCPPPRAHHPLRRLLSTRALAVALSCAYSASLRPLSLCERCAGVCGHCAVSAKR